MAHCLSCHSYVIHESSVCASCHEKNNLRVLKGHPISYGPNNREWNFRYKMIKGKLAETLVEQLFLSHKYSVYRYGLEYIAPGLSASLKDMPNEVTASKLRQMPDFVVQHRLYRETHFVEVKYRGNGYFSERELDKTYSYDDALIIVVSSRHIKCLSVRELKQGWEITPHCNNYLAYRSEFQLRKDVVIDFCKFAERFFENAV